MIIKPEEAGFSPERLERITHHIENRYMQAGKVAGCQVLVARHGHVAYYRSFGLRDRERELPMSDDTIFRIYSMTKPIASVALMQLFEQGHFQLSDPVARFIPAWADLEVYSSGDKDDMKTEPCARPMSVRDALMHMTGLASGGDPTHPVDAAYRESRSDPDNPGMLRMRRGATLQTLVDGLASMPLKFQPGTRWSYGLSTDICGYLVEVMSGKPFDRYLADHVFGPLGMPDTGFHIPAEKVGRFAANYGRRRDKSLALFDDPEKSAYLRPPTYFSGAGGLCSTTADYLRFCQMLLNGGELDGERVLGRKTIALMAQNHIPAGRWRAARWTQWPKRSPPPARPSSGVGRRRAWPPRPSPRP